MKKSVAIVVIASFCFMLVGSATHTATVPQKQVSVNNIDTVTNSMDKLANSIDELEKRF